MALRVAVKQRGVDRAQRMLRAAHHAVADVRPVLGEIGEMLVRRVRQRLSTSLAAGGGRLRPTKRGNQPLMGTGRLMNSISHTVSRRQVTIGSPLPYAAIHQFGGFAGRQHRTFIPARPYLVTPGGEPDAVDASRAQEIIADWVRRRVQKA